MGPRRSWLRVIARAWTCGLVLLAGGFATGDLRAATVTWDGGAATGAWATGTNWSTNSVPAGTDSLIFDASLANNQYSILLGGSRSAAGITFNSASGSNAFSFSTTSGVLTLGAGGLINNDSDTQTFTTGVAVNAAQTWSAAAGGFNVAAVTLLANLTVTGTGPTTFGGGGGALLQSGGNRTLTLSGTGTTSIGAVTLSESNTARTLTIAGTGSAAVTGVIANGGTGAGKLTMSSSGTLTLSGANTFSGGTQVNAGTLAIGSNQALGTGLLALAANTTVQSAGGARSLTNAVSSSGNLTIAGTNDLTFSGAFALGGGNRTITVSNSGITTLSGAVSSTGYATITKAGTGTLVLSGTNTLSGPTVINAGALELRSSTGLGSGTWGNIVASGGELRLGSGISLSPGGLTVQGSGVSGAGAVRNLDGSNTLGGQITVNNATTIGSDAGLLTFSGLVNLNTGAVLTTTGAGDLTFAGAVGGSGALNFNSSGDVTISSTIQTNGALTLNGPGTVTLSGTATNTNNGAVTVNNGMLVLAKTGATALQTNVSVMNGTLQLGGSNQIADYSSVSLGSSTALFDLNNNSDTIANLSMTGASVSTGTGTLTIGGGGVATNAASSAATISGKLALGATTTFTVADGGAGSDLVVSATVSGASGAGLVKAGAGTMVLSGNNAYAGSTTVNLGTLKLGTAGSAGNGPLGTTAAGTVVNSGGALDLNGFTLANAEALSLNGTGVGSAGALTNSSPTAATYAGAVTLGSASSIGGVGNITLTAGLGGNFLLTESGPGTLTLNGSGGTRIGGAQVNAGTLKLGATNALGAATQTITLNGGTLDLATDTSTNAYAVAVTGNSTVNSDKATSGSAGITQTLGALSIGNRVLSVAAGSNVAANSAYGLGFGGTTLSDTATFNIGNNGTGTGTLLLGTVSGVGGLIKSGNGTLSLSGANSYSGTTTISQGTIALGSSAPSGANGALGNATSVVTLNDANTAAYNTALTLAASSLTVGRAVSVANAGSGVSTLGGDASLTSGTGSFTGNITLNRTTNLQSFGTSNVTFGTGVISGSGGIAKAGDGTVTLTSVNTFTGGVTVNQGTLTGAVSTGATLLGGFAALGNYTGLATPTTVITVNNGATLALQSSYTGSASTAPTYDQQLMTLNGAGVAGGGALRSTGGVSSWLGSIVLGSDATITNTGVAGAGGDALYLGPWTTNNAAVYLNLNDHALTLNGAGNIAITESIGNSAGDTGSVTLSGASATRYTYAGLKNYYTGATNVNSGVLRLQVNPGGAPGIVTANSAVLGDLTIGTNSATTTATVQLAFGNQIADNANITINSDGTLDLGTYGMAETVGHLVLNGGTISLTGANNGALFLGGVASGADIDVGNSRTSTISSGGIAALDMNNVGGAARTFNIAGASTLNLTAPINGGSLVKDGAGTLILASANAYNGTTEIRSGTLVAANAYSLGSYQNVTFAAAQTSVAAGATLQLKPGSGNVSFQPESLVLNGAGVGGAGALENVSGNNTWTGGITLGSDSTVKADAGTSFTITGSIDGSAATGQAQTLTIGGPGNTTITGPVSDGTGGGRLQLVKNDASTLTLNSVNSFTGAITINAGTLAVPVNNTFGSLTNSVAVAGGATFALSGGNSFTNTIGALTGSGLVSIAANTNLKVVNGGADAFDGRLTGTGLFEKAGAGTFTFSSTSNTSSFNYGGTVKLDAGTLEFRGGSSTNALTLTNLTLSGGTLLLTGSYINVGTLNITANTFLDFGTGGASILNAANVYIAAGVTLTVQNWTSETDFLFANSAFRQNNGSGTLAVYNAVGAVPESQVHFANDPNSADGSHTTWINSNFDGYTNFEIRPIPEPATYGVWLIGGCLAFLGWRRRRRSKSD